MKIHFFFFHNLIACFIMNFQTPINNYINSMQHSKGGGGLVYIFLRDFKHYNGKKEEIIEEKIVIKEKVEGK